MTPRDALSTRILDELRSFVAWLDDNNAHGYIGEVGWPEGTRSEWNALAEEWFDLADRFRLWVTVWATGEWWSRDYPLAAYRKVDGEFVNATNSQADVLEGHLSIPDVRRGVNVAGGEFGTPVTEPTSAFSDRSPGDYDRDYHYDSEATFAYLASRGIRLVRLPFRWERIQPDLGGEELDPEEVARIKTAVAAAASQGIEVVLDMHNYGAYYHHEDGRGVRSPIGSQACSIAQLVAAWGSISAAFSTDEGVIAYGLMNEPVGLPSDSIRSDAELWREASQAVIDVIRELGDDKIIMVSGYPWASIRQWAQRHPSAWIDDPMDRVFYEAHHYFDRDGSGTYARSYAEEVEAAERGSR